MTDHTHNGWKIRLFQDSALAVRNVGNARTGIARKRGETSEEMLRRLCMLLDKVENAYSGNAFLRKGIELPS